VLCVKSVDIEHAAWNPLEKRLFGTLLQDMLYGNGVLGCAVPTFAHAERLAGFLATDLGRRITELTLVCVLGPTVVRFNCFVNFYSSYYVRNSSRAEK
jgi:hypothetical protein